VYGSRSVGNLFEVFGLPRDHYREVTGGDSVEAGTFRIRFIRSVHGKLLGRIPFDRDISAEATPPLKTRDFGCGEVFNILIEAGDRRIYHQGSGGIVEQNLEGHDATLAIVGISSRRGTPRMIYRVVRALRPKVVMPTHYDQFFFPLGAGMRAIPFLDFKGAVREANEAVPGIEIVTLPLLGEYRIEASSSAI
jgi:L-ascorbate metabolism protein UlaG (beta-lactamase superfamily)